MGFRHSWIAVQGLERERAIEALGMEVSAMVEPGYFPDGIAVGDQPGGWLIVLTDRSASAFEGKLVALAAFGPAVACDVSDTVMYCEARGYEAGKQVWRVAYDCEKGQYALAREGNPPPELDEIYRAARAEQEAEGGEEADVDCMFEVPADLAQAVCGFKLGEGNPDDLHFAELRVPGSARLGFFARLFGRG